MDNTMMVNGTELHLRIRFKCIRSLQPSPPPRRSAGCRSRSAAPTDATNALQLLSPLVRKHALMLRVHRQAASLQPLLPTGSTAPPRHAGISHLTSCSPRLVSPKPPTSSRDGHCHV